MAQSTTKLGLYLWEIADQMEQTFEGYNGNMALLEELLVAFTDLPYDKIGNAAKFLSSIYIPNDANIFGYMANGTYSNMATIEQNDVFKIGDTTIDKAWLVANQYYQVRAPKMEWVEEYNPDQSAKKTREYVHMGILASHAFMRKTTGTQVLTQNSINLLTGLDSIASNFPVGSVSGQSYTIPRSGIYQLTWTIRPSALTVANSMVNVGVRRNRGGSNTDQELITIPMSTGNATGFFTAGIQYDFLVGDIITPFAKPINENVTVQTGTKFHISFDSDMPSS